MKSPCLAARSGDRERSGVQVCKRAVLGAKLKACAKWKGGRERERKKERRGKRSARACEDVPARPSRDDDSSAVQTRRGCMRKEAEKKRTRTVKENSDGKR